MSGSPFLDIPESEWLLSNPLAFAIADGFPVSPGHALVITKRVVPTWLKATPDEKSALWGLADEVVAHVHAERQPDGFNLGINVNEAAGQTVMHLHLHVIPRYRGDVEDPRGGIRHVIPAKGNYLAGT